MSDYGLTREGEYYYSQTTADLPIRWMAPEALTKRRWSEKSDVWSFGVMLWELWTAGEMPFALEESNQAVAQKVRRTQVTRRRSLRRLRRRHEPNALATEHFGFGCALVAPGEPHRPCLIL